MMWLNGPSPEEARDKVLDGEDAKATQKLWSRALFMLIAMVAGYHFSQGNMLWGWVNIALCLGNIWLQRERDTRIDSFLGDVIRYLHKQTHAHEQQEDHEP